MMMPYQSYRLWEIERTKSVREQRAADVRCGQFAALLMRLAVRPAGRYRPEGSGPRRRPEPRPAPGRAEVCNTEG